MKHFYLFLLFSFLSFPVIGQVAGSSSRVNKSFSFQETLNDIYLDPSPKIGVDSKVSFSKTFSNPLNRQNIGLGSASSLLGVNNISIPSEILDVVNGANIFCGSANAYIETNASVDIEGYYMVKSVGSSSIDIDYPIEIFIDYPSANSFGCGDEIRISTSYQVLQPQKTDKLKVKSPFINQQLGASIKNLKFNTKIGLDASFAFGVEIPYPCEKGVCYKNVCGPYVRFNESVPFGFDVPIPSLPPFLELCEKAFGPNATEASLFSCGALSGVTPLLELSQRALDAYNASKGTQYSIASFPDEHSVTVYTPDLPEGGPTLPEIEGNFKDYSKSDLGFQSLNGGKTLKLSGFKFDITKTSLDVISLIDYSGVPTSFSVGGGLGSVDIGDISPTFSVDQIMDYQYDPVVHLQIDLGREMAYTVHKPDNSVSHAGTGNIVNLLAGEYILVQFPQDLSNALTATSTSSMDGTFTTKGIQNYYRSINVKFGEVDIPSILTKTLIDETILKSKFGTNTILDNSFNLQVPTHVNLPNFILDPENPIITISSLTIEDIINLGKGKRAVAYKVGVKNDGDVRLDDIEVFLPLGETYTTANNFKVTCNESAMLNVDATYDAFINTNLLSPGNSLEPGEERFINVLIEVNPETSKILTNDCFAIVDYYATATANGVSPIGTRVTNNYNHCTKDTRGEVIIAQIDLGASIINSIEDFTVYASKSLTFSKQQVLSKGNIGSGKDLVFENVSSKGSGVAEIIGDLHVQENIDMQGQSDVEIDYAQIGGELRTLGNSTSLTTTGTTKSKSNCVAIYDVPDTNMARFSSKTKVNVGANEIRNLPPGNYSEVRLSTGSQLVMSPGTYQIKTWKFNGNAKVLYNLIGDLSIEIFIDKWNVEKGNLTFDISGNGSSRNINYYLSKKGNTHFRNTKITGNIYAPETGVVFDLNSTMNGSCYAESIIFRANSNFVGHDYLEPLNIPEACLNSISIPMASIEKVKEQEVKSYVSVESVQNATQELPMSVYPNPFTDLINVSIYIEHSGMANIQIYDNRGKLIKTLKNGYFSEGEYNLPFILDNLSSGIYFCKLTTAYGTSVQRILKK